MKSSTSLISKLLDATGVRASEPMDDAGEEPIKNVPRTPQAKVRSSEDDLAQELKRLFGEKPGFTPMD